MSAPRPAWHVETFGIEAAMLLAGLHGRCFAEAWPACSMTAFLATPGSTAFLASAAPSQGPAGFLLARAAGGDAELISLGVLPERRRQGCAHALVHRLVEWAEAQALAALFLEVGENNRAARALYQDFGFAIVGRRPHYYRRGVGRRADALVMRRHLSQAAGST